MAFYSSTIKYMDIVEPYHPERSEDNLSMYKAYRTLLTILSVLSDDVLHKSIRLSTASNRRIRKGGGTTYFPLKAMARRCSSSS
ncbi:hypothetical protein Syun_012315 [Stephania yunnanensis]|uniref:Uncharacterized protein n=1 Tax=Stephania yunnanensis TaxID=152371 RepID=A0AAP0PIW5_9MAGN